MCLQCIFNGFSPVVDALGDDDQVAPRDGDADPAVRGVTDVKVTRALPDEAAEPQSK